MERHLAEARKLSKEYQRQAERVLRQKEASKEKIEAEIRALQAESRARLYERQIYWFEDAFSLLGKQKLWMKATDKTSRIGEVR